MDHFLRIGFAGDREQLKRGLSLFGELLNEFESENAAAHASR